MDNWLQLEPDICAPELRDLAYQNGKSAAQVRRGFRKVSQREATRDTIAGALAAFAFWTWEG